jgi:hypothetical protein
VFVEFENRLTDLLADALSGISEIAVLRTLDGVAPQSTVVQIAPRLTRFEPDPTFGDDDPDRIGPRPELRLRSTLHARGEMLLALRIGPPGNGSTAADQRRKLLSALDRVLPRLGEIEVRRGGAFTQPSDQGFELDAFRLLGVNETEGAAGQLDARYGFAGRFWPAGVETVGEAIRRIPVRIAVLPVTLPERPIVREGTDIQIPVRLDLRSLESRATGEVGPAAGAGRLRARLRGASPPGTLIGGTASATGAGRAYDQSAPGAFTVSYRAPGTVAGRAEAHIELAFEREGEALIELGEVVVEVTP